MATFIQGLKLSELFYQQAVKPILDTDFPNLNYTACLIGSGSEILGFDTEMSSDHHWGPRLIVFLKPEDVERDGEAIKNALSHKLPKSFHGYSTHFSPPNPDDNDTQLLETIEEGPINHRVELFTLAGFTIDYLDIMPTQNLGIADWLTIPAQKLRTMTAGAVYHDGLGELTALRERLAYYPHDVWLYLLIAGWTRIGQEEHLMGRAGYAGDELGSRLIATRLVHDLMNLCFLMEKQYAPYPKWFGTAFQKLACGDHLTPLFHKVLDAKTWQEREQALIPAYEFVAQMHNQFEITPKVKVPTNVQQFFGRPFKISRSGEIINALSSQITDADVKQLVSWNPIGAVEQFSTSTDLLSTTPITRKAQALYE